jgi:threonine dehydrogenase-like Zn-dependent dehydrogenase
MKQISMVFKKKRKITFETRSIPDPNKGECLIRNSYTMISPGTELALYNGTHIGFNDPEISWARYPIEPGYAGLGEVVDCRTPDGPPTGTAILYYPPHSSHGILKPDTAVWQPIPEKATSSVDQLTFLPLRFAQIALTAVLARVRPSRNVLVYGAGIVGNFCAQLFQHIPGVEQVVLTDLSATRLALANSCGAATTSLPDDIPALSFDTIVEATGSPGVVPMALQKVASRGQVILLGSTRGTVELNVYKYIHRKLVALLGSHETLLPTYADESLSKDAVQTGMEISLDSIRSQRDALRWLVQATQNGTLKTSPFLQEFISPGEADSAYRKLQDNPERHLGICIDWRNIDALSNEQ